MATGSWPDLLWTANRSAEPNLLQQRFEFDARLVAVVLQLIRGEHVDVEPVELVDPGHRDSEYLADLFIGQVSLFEVVGECQHDVHPHNHVDELRRISGDRFEDVRFCYLAVVVAHECMPPPTLFAY